MAYARYLDEDTDTTVYAKGNADTLREIFEYYMGGSRASVIFQLIEQPPEGIDLSKKRDLTNNNAYRAALQFEQGDISPRSGYFLEVDGFPEDIRAGVNVLAQA